VGGEPRTGAPNPPPSSSPQRTWWYNEVWTGHCKSANWNMLLKQENEDTTLKLRAKQKHSKLNKMQSSGLRHHIVMGRILFQRTMLHLLVPQLTEECNLNPHLHENLKSHFLNYSLWAHFLRKNKWQNSYESLCTYTINSLNQWSDFNSWSRSYSDGSDPDSIIF